MMQSTLEKLWDAARQMIDGFISRLPAFVLALAVFIAFYGLSHLVERAIQQAASKRRQNLVVVFARLTAWAIILFGILVAMSIVAPSFQAADLIKILGIGGVAIGFAFQNVLQNFLAGLLLLWAEPFRVGDEIKLDAYEGRVEEIQTRATIIKTHDNRQVVIPNADLFTRSVIVNPRLGSRRWHYDLAVKRVPDLQGLKKTLVSAIRKVAEVGSDSGPEAVITELTPDMVKIRILWSTKHTPQHEMFASYDRVLTAIAEALDSFESAKQASAA